MEDVGVVVGSFVLEDGDEAFEAHAGIDVFGWEGAERAVLLAIELDEDVVPDLDDVGVAGVDEVGGVAFLDAHRGEAIDVDLCAGAARAGLAHLPEVVLHVSGEDVVRRQDLEPEVFGFIVGWEAEFLVAFEVCGVQGFGGEFVDLGEEFPGPLDGFLFEVVSEGPIAEHLEEGVVVGVLADIVEVVVLAAGADALLAVDSALETGEGV